MYHGKTVGVVIPAHNEAPCIARVVSGFRSLRAADGTPVVDHIVVCDNASSDRTAAQARRAGACVVYEPRKGYGNACQSALKATPEVDWVVFADGDEAMRPADLPRLLNQLQDGAQLVIGSRVLGAKAGVVEPGSVLIHQRFGNWLAAKLLNAFWSAGATDLGPYRAIARPELTRLAMQDRTFGWTAEMQARALSLGMRVDEIAVANRKRNGVSKVSGTVRGSIGAALGIITRIVGIGLADKWTTATPVKLRAQLWAQRRQSLNIEDPNKDSMWKNLF